MQYFYRDQPCSKTVYHWHQSCALVPENPSEREGWVATERAPQDRAGCTICAELDGTKAPEPGGKKLRATTPSVPGAIRCASSL